MQIPARPTVTGGGPPPPQVLQRLKDTGLILGDEGAPVVLGMEGLETLQQIAHGMGLSGLGFTKQPTGWQSLWQSVIGGWSATGQQIALNKNQAIIAQTTPYGTTVYQPTAPQGPTTPTGQAIREGAGVANTLLIAGAMLLAVVLITKR
jgi:hypothetical protein